MVALGTLVSATWIIAANSWMHTPAGFSINGNGQFEPVDWWAIIFNPSFPYRLVHTVLAAFLTTAFAVGGVGAFHLLRDRASAPARVMFSMAMWMAALVTPLQIVAGDLHGLNTLEHQPAKIAAIEGHYETRRGAPLVLFGIPDDQAEVTRYALEVPKLGSLILAHDINGEIKGLKTFPPDERPPALIPFMTFRVMVGLGFLMLAVGLWSLWARWRGTLYASQWLHLAALVMAPSGFVAVLAGWLRTADSLATVDAQAVGASLIGFIVVYFFVFGAGTFYILRLMARGVAQEELKEGPLRAAGITPAIQIEEEGTNGG
jgi:cytochrome d ubiquinol oxidase subunit I